MSLYIYQATCERVVDGDTLDLVIDLGLSVFVRERIRLHGLDTPETYGVPKDSEEYAAGMAAKIFVEERVLCLNEPLTVKTIKDRKGKYGRYLARIYLPRTNEDLNEALIQAGHAKRVDY